MLPLAFKDLGLSAPSLQILTDLGFTAPTPIQQGAIPLMLAGRDLTGQSQTGSGKTAAFGLPIVEKIKVDGPNAQALILCPTRELAVQVAKDMKRFLRAKPGARVQAVYGGEPIAYQIKSLRHGAHVIIATPGRLLDHLDRGTIDLGATQILVLDEADRMLDMGFIEDIEKVIATTPAQRQTVLFSATFPESVLELIAKHQERPEMVKIESETAQNIPAIEQIRYNVTEASKFETLLGLLVQRDWDQVLIFCNLKRQVDNITDMLRMRGLTVGKLHGDLEQRDRDLVMLKFRNRSLAALVATDVAARGIDVDSLPAVVNYDLPVRDEDYVHRIGRTGRAGRTGVSVAFVAENDGPKVARLEELTGIPLKTAEPLGEVSPAALRASRGPAMETLVVFAGRKDKIRPGDILGALTGEAGGLRADQIGKIDIFDHYTYVAVARGVARDTLRCLQAGRIKGRKLRVEVAR